MTCHNHPSKVVAISTGVGFPCGALRQSTPPVHEFSSGMCRVRSKQSNSSCSLATRCMATTACSTKWPLQPAAPSGHYSLQHQVATTACSTKWPLQPAAPSGHYSLQHQVATTACSTKWPLQPAAPSGHYSLQHQVATTACSTKWPEQACPHMQ